MASLSNIIFLALSAMAMFANMVQGGSLIVKNMCSFPIYCYSSSACGGCQIPSAPPFDEVAAGSSYTGAYPANNVSKIKLVKEEDLNRIPIKQTGNVANQVSTHRMPLASTFTAASIPLFRPPISTNWRLPSTSRSHTPTSLLSTVTPSCSMSAPSITLALPTAQTASRALRVVQETPAATGQRA